MTCLYYSYCIVLYLMIHFVLGQFPVHVDLQKVDEIVFNNEKYNVLKPTVHKVTDHFKDFIRREIKNKDERVFIDDNGFRHFWSGIGSTKRSLRKTEVSLFEINKNLDENKKANVESISKLVKKGLKRPKTTSEEKSFEKAILRQATTVKPAGGKTVAVTSFFCPFFGVIKMTSLLN